MFGISGGTLILDRAPPKSLGSHIQFSLNTTTDKIELGHLDFDAADFIPSAAGSLSGKIELTEHGKPVYQLSMSASRWVPAARSRLGLTRAPAFISSRTDRYAEAGDVARTIAGRKPPPAALRRAGEATSEVVSPINPGIE
jgi:hypothetical protein